MIVLLKKSLRFTVIILLCLIIVTLFAVVGCGDEKESKIVHQKTEFSDRPCEIGDEATTNINISEKSINLSGNFIFSRKRDPFETKVEIVNNVLYMHIIDKCYSKDPNSDPCYWRQLYYYTFNFVFDYQGKISKKYKILLYSNHHADLKGPITIISEGIINSKN